MYTYCIYVYATKKNNYVHLNARWRQENVFTYYVNATTKINMMSILM